MQTFGLENLGKRKARVTVDFSPSEGIIYSEPELQITRDIEAGRIEFFAHSDLMPGYDTGAPNWTVTYKKL